MGECLKVYTGITNVDASTVPAGIYAITGSEANTWTNLPYSLSGQTLIITQNTNNFRDYIDFTVEPHVYVAFNTYGANELTYITLV